jgi:diguanylate cyclase (GGDEF)-like protein
LQQLKQKGFIKNQECLMRRYSGETFWCSRSAVVRKDKDGKMQWIDGVVEDITDRKLAENLLRKAKEDLEIQVAARTIELTKLNEELHQLSLLDGLTGIGNRRCLDEVLAREWKRAVREQAKLAILMIDIDYFKLFNDTYGHLAGDECLKKVAATINGIIKRPMDFAGRYGGEEFAVILPATDEQGAMTVGEKIRLTIEVAAIPHKRSYLGGVVTVSIGVAVMIPKVTTDAVLLIDAADQALYTAKSSGRNQVILAE